MRTATRTAPERVVPSPPLVDSVVGAMADQIIAQFNTWAFKRQQPARFDLLRATVMHQVATGQAINFILYWGKGPRNSAAAPDIQCLDFLDTLSRRIAKVHAPGARFTLIETDTHARLNGHDDAAITSYYREIDQLAAQRGMQTQRLSDIVAQAGPAPAQPSTNEAALITALTRSAKRWYRGPGGPADGARRYLAMNFVEKRAVERFAPNAIFVTFNGSGLDALFPDKLAIFYMYSLKRGTAVKPWFLDATGQPFEGVT